jgi:hypothetical protein
MDLRVAETLFSRPHTDRHRTVCDLGSKHVPLEGVCFMKSVLSFALFLLLDAIAAPLFA